MAAFTKDPTNATHTILFNLSPVIRRMTFIVTPRPSRLRKPARALDVADLGEMYRVVSSLELPPLREVEIAAVGVLETELARIQRREPLDGLSAPLARGLHGCDQLADHLSG